VAKQVAWHEETDDGQQAYFLNLIMDPALLTSSWAETERHIRLSFRGPGRRTSKVRRLIVFFEERELDLRTVASGCRPTWRRR